MATETHCSACDAPIIWATHAKTRKPNPIDAAPADDGNIELLNGNAYRIVPQAERAELVGRLHTSHFVTCPEAARFRGGR